MSKLTNWTRLNLIELWTGLRDTCQLNSGVTIDFTRKREDLYLFVQLYKFYYRHVLFTMITMFTIITICCDFMRSQTVRLRGRIMESRDYSPDCWIKSSLLIARRICSNFANAVDSVVITIIIVHLVSIIINKSALLQSWTLRFTSSPAKDVYSSLIEVRSINKQPSAFFHLVFKADIHAIVFVGNWFYKSPNFSVKVKEN